MLSWNMENLVYGHGNLLLTHHGKSTSHIMACLVITSWKFLFHFIYHGIFILDHGNFAMAKFPSFKTIFQNCLKK